MIENEHLSTGIRGFDEVIKQVLPGDNIVWQVDSVEDFIPLVEPYCKNAIESGWERVYFRFAKHSPFVTAEQGANVIQLDPADGFEAFTTEVHNVINRFGKGHYYLFDCLSELAPAWCNDRMLGNFFMQVCPQEYHKLKIGDRYELARLIGRLTRAESTEGRKNTMLIGPGKWGTSTPSLGVPVSYPEIHTVSVLAEIAIFNKEISAEVSLGTHFFSDLIENDTLYLGILPNRDSNICRADFFANNPNQLEKVLPEYKSWSKVIKVIHAAQLKHQRKLSLYANAIERDFMLYLD